MRPYWEGKGMMLVKPIWDCVWTGDSDNLSRDQYHEFGRERLYTFGQVLFPYKVFTQQNTTNEKETYRHGSAV